MLYLYDNAIAKDLQLAIDDKSSMNSHVKVMDPGGLIGLLSQIEEDKLSFPILCLMRDDSIVLDSSRFNFTQSHFGHAEVIDPETNNVYLEQAIPIELRYALHILATNTADVDELIREILFKYTKQYFLTIDKPYESKTKLRFGVAIPPGTEIQKQSSSGEYIKEGKLYESVVPLICEGAVYLNYTPKHIVRVDVNSQVDIKG